MNRLGKILTLGLEKKRAWQLPIIAGLLVVFGLGVRWWYNSRAAQGIRLLDMVDLNDVDGVRWILRWDKGQVKEEGEVSEARTDENELLTWKYCPLSLAAARGHTEVVKILLKAGADVNANDNHGLTPSHCAAGEGHPEAAKILLKAGAEVNAKDKNGWTSLHWAAFRGYTETAKVLLKARAEANAKDKWGKTPLDSVNWGRGVINPKEQAKCAELLRKHGAKTGAELDAEAKQGKK